MKNIPYSKEQLMRANVKLMEQNKRYREALEKVAFKQFNVEPKRVVVKLQSIARKALEDEE